MPKTRTRPSMAPAPIGVSLTAGPLWTSWEKFRVQGQDGLGQVPPGTVGTLITRSGQYRIVPEQDFQRLLGLARDVERIQGGLRVIVAAVSAVQRHRDESTVNTLVEAVALLGDTPTLPTRDRFAPLAPEGLAIEEGDDEVELDPAAIRRPYVTVGAAETPLAVPAWKIWRGVCATCRTVPMPSRSFGSSPRD